jgi:hypothetical protein
MNWLLFTNEAGAFAGFALRRDGASIAFVAPWGAGADRWRAATDEGIHDFAQLQDAFAWAEEQVR